MQGSSVALKLRECLHSSDPVLIILPPHQVNKVQVHNNTITTTLVLQHRDPHGYQAHVQLTSSPITAVQMS